MNTICYPALSAKISPEVQFKTILQELSRIFRAELQMYSCPQGDGVHHFWGLERNGDDVLCHSSKTTRNVQDINEILRAHCAHILPSSHIVHIDLEQGTVALKSQNNE